MTKENRTAVRAPDRDSSIVQNPKFDAATSDAVRKQNAENDDAAKSGRTPRNFRS